MIPQMLCNTCINYLGGGKCKAFEKIPMNIISGKSKHYTTTKGQIGEYVFTKSIKK
jgi:hypothetical protein